MTNTKTTIHGLFDHGQSAWLDDISKCIIDSGRLKELVYSEGIRGMTTNPSIFEKAISSGECGYPDAIRKLLSEGKTPVEVYETLSCDDVQRASDVMRKLHDESDSVDGFISWEEAPEWGENEEKSVSEAERLRAIVDRPNVFIKVPSTPEGIAALRRLIRKGISINMTLIFSQEQYVAVAKSFLAGLEDRQADGNPIDRVRSVASVFISRLDSAVDKQLDASDNQAQAAALKGKIGLANTKMIYQHFLKLFKTERFEKLAAHGARVQRPLWASTGTKNPDYSDTMYIDNLIGADTVNTMPAKTVEAFLDHGGVRADTVLEGVDEAKDQLAGLETLGISISSINKQLLIDGLAAFAKSYDELIATIQRSLEVAHEKS